MNKTQLSFQKYHIYSSYNSQQQTGSNPHLTKKKIAIPTKSPKNLSLKPNKRTTTNMGSHIFTNTWNMQNSDPQYNSKPLYICKYRLINTLELYT